MGFNSGFKWLRNKERWEYSILNRTDFYLHDNDGGDFWIVALAYVYDLVGSYVWCQHIPSCFFFWISYIILLQGDCRRNYWPVRRGTATCCHGISEDRPRRFWFRTLYHLPVVTLTWSCFLEICVHFTKFWSGCLNKKSGTSDRRIVCKWLLQKQG